MSRTPGRARKAIAVFDSGVGGLTVFRALRRAMPSERMLYFGDTARLPYGSKTKEAVTRFSLEIAQFLRRRDIKMLVVACNSASALALPALKAALPFPVVGVIVPAARAAASASRKGVIGVIGTEATVASGVYRDAIRGLSRKARVAAVACPLLVPLVEEGWWESSVTASVVRTYLSRLHPAGMDVLILGCTHYPLIKPLIQKEAGAGVRLIDSGEEAAREVQDLLEVEGIRNAGGRGSEEFFVTDGPERFKRLAARILGKPVRRVSLARLPL